VWCLGTWEEPGVLDIKCVWGTAGSNRSPSRKGAQDRSQMTNRAVESDTHYGKMILRQVWVDRLEASKSWCSGTCCGYLIFICFTFRG
jgi:hypothetical protein